VATSDPGRLPERTTWYPVANRPHPDHAGQGAICTDGHHVRPAPPSSQPAREGNQQTVHIGRTNDRAALAGHATPHSGWADPGHVAATLLASLVERVHTAQPQELLTAVTTGREIRLYVPP
jgi:hypothetical protein